ncbi:hypothetical protein BDZ89DRAFT_1056228, partial [Hymenopellis radicata]
SDNLQSYIISCHLPELKLGPNAPALAPRITSERPRRLEHINNMFGDMNFVKDCELSGRRIVAKVPSQPLNIADEDPELGEAVTLPSERCFDVPVSWHRPAEDLHKIGDWLEDFPLVTVQRILHIRVHERDVDREIMQFFLWSKHEGPGSTPLSLDLRLMVQTKSVIVAFQPPWVLSPRDMKQFATCDVPHNCIDMGNMTSKERLWAKLWDVCVQNETHYFVLTSYNQWIFGAFDARAVAGSLAFWIASAMRLTGFVIPKVALSRALQVLVKPPKIDDIDVIIPNVSESNWTGKSDDVASSAGYCASTVSSKVSDAGVYPTMAPMYNQPINRDAIKQWLQG